MVAYCCIRVVQKALLYFHSAISNQPHIDYCNLVWGGTSQINLERIFRLQKRACKIILDYNIDNIYQSMEDLKILTVFERLFLRKSKFLFKVDRSETPPYINDMFNQRIFNENMPLLTVEETSRSAAWLTFRSLQQFVRNLAFLARSGNKMSLFGYLY